MTAGEGASELELDAVELGLASGSISANNK